MEESVSFTDSERRVARLLAQGKSNAEIALELGISVRTVEFHLTNIYEKMGVQSRGEAIVRLLEHPYLLEPRASAAAQPQNGSGVSLHGAEDATRVPESPLRETAGPPPPDPVESTVAEGGRIGNNGSEIILPETRAPLPPPQSQLLEYRTPRPVWAAIVGLVLAISAILWQARPTAWEIYTRECENSDGFSVGQTLERTNASKEKVPGQFGVTGAPPWPGQPGQVVYREIYIPKMEELYLRLRYSKFSTPTVPILVYLDDDIAPRFKIDPIDQHGWEAFTWTQPVLLGEVKKAGVHSFKFITEGQPYGFADLDMFELLVKMPRAVQTP